MKFYYFLIHRLGCACVYLLAYFTYQYFSIASRFSFMIDACCSANIQAANIVCFLINFEKKLYNRIMPSIFNSIDFRIVYPRFQVISNIHGLLSYVTYIIIHLFYLLERFLIIYVYFLERCLISFFNSIIFSGNSFYAFQKLSMILRNRKIA